jgi:hypothetical protein
MIGGRKQGVFGGRAVILRPVVCWDCVFDSCRGHGCVSVVGVLCCQRSLTESMLWCVIRCYDSHLALKTDR